MNLPASDGTTFFCRRIAVFDETFPHINFFFLYVRSGQSVRVYASRLNGHRGRWLLYAPAIILTMLTLFKLFTVCTL